MGACPLVHTCPFPCLPAWLACLPWLPTPVSRAVHTPPLWRPSPYLSRSPRLPAWGIPCLLACGAAPSSQNPSSSSPLTHAPPAGHGGAGLTPNIHFFRPRVFRRVRLQHGYLRVTANATHLRHTALSSYDGTVMDELLLVKPPGWTFRPRPLPMDVDLSAVGGAAGARLLRGGPAAAAA